MSGTDTIAKQRFAVELMKLNDSIQKYELESASWSLSKQENQEKLSTWNTLNVEPSITSLSERIHMALIQENQDSIIAVLQRNSNSINQFITYSTNLVQTSPPKKTSNESLIQELKQLEASEKQLIQQIDQLAQQKKTANRKDLAGLNSDQEAKEQQLTSTRLAIASKTDEIAKNDIENTLRINGYEPSDSLVDHLLDRASARNTEQKILQRLVSAQAPNPASLDDQRAVLQAETTVVQNQMRLASPVEKEALANKLQELEASLDSINTELLALAKTTTTNSTTNEGTPNEVAVNPAETNTPKSATNATNPITNEGTPNEVAVNPAETNTPKSLTNTTNPTTNEGTPNELAVNPAETNTPNSPTNNTNPTTNEGTPNEVAVNPAETNTPKSLTNTTNPTTNEGTPNDVAVNPAETNTPNSPTNATNPTTNESTPNDVAVNSGEPRAETVQGLKTVEQQKTENAINEVQELQSALSALQPEKGKSDNSVALMKNQLRIANALLELKTTLGDSIYALIIGEKQTEMLAESLSESIADLSKMSQVETQLSSNTAEIITNGLAVKRIPVKMQPFTPDAKLELTPQQRTKLASDRAYDEYLSLRKEFVSIASKRNEIESQVAQKRVALFRAVDADAIEVISEEMAELAKTLTLLKSQESGILSSIERMEDREAYHVLANQGIAPTQELANAPLDPESLSFTLNSDKKQGNRYPILTTLPKGLIFRIQVGVFRNAVPDYFFREFSPVSGERLTDELTAYLTGFFVNSTQANDAKGQVRGLGYTDAFVVAYCDGKRITLKQALEYEKKGLCTLRTQEEVLSEASVLLNAQESLMPTAINIPKEVYYTVQVAALKNQDNGKLKNVPALFYLQSKTGLYKYNSGKFKQMNDAKQQRDALKALGYTDAYIVAYRDGIPVNFKEIELALSYEREAKIRLYQQKQR